MGTMKRIHLSITPEWGDPPRTVTLGYRHKDSDKMSWARIPLKDAQHFGFRRCVCILRYALHKGDTPGRLLFPEGTVPVECGHA